MSPNRDAAQTAADVCVLGRADPAWLNVLRDDLPRGVELREVDATAADAALRQLSASGVRGDLVLIEADALLPDHWLVRLRAILALPDVLAVAALEPRLLPGLDAPADLAELQQLDARCHSWGRREALDAGDLDSPVLALRAGALEVLAAGGFRLDVDALPLPWRVLRAGDLLVARKPGSDPRPKAGDSIYRDLADTLQAATDAPDPGLPGLDGKPVILHINHGWGGGAARWVRDFAEADPDHHHLLLAAHGSFRRRCHGERFTLGDARGDGPPWREFTPARGIADSAIHHPGYSEFLESVLSDYGVDAVMVSSLIGHGLDALRTGLPTSVVVHDHYPLWPLLHCDFGDPDIAFDDAQLAASLASVGQDFEFAHRQPAHWLAVRRAYVEAVLAAKANLVAPSASAMAAQLRLAPKLESLPRQVIPHGLAAWPEATPLAAPPVRQRLRLLVPGRVRKGKGADLLHAMLPALTEHAELVLLGAGSEGMDFFGQSGVHVVLDYQHEDLPRLLALFQPDAALILSTVAETFSYTLSEMRSLGLPVIATAVGALIERIADGRDGLLVAPKADAVLECIARLADDSRALGTIRGHLADGRSEPGVTEMVAAHVALLAPGCAATSFAATIAGNVDVAARNSRNRIRQLDRKLAQLGEEIAALKTEVERRGEWAWALDREQRKAANQVAELHEQLDARTEWALSLDRELQELKPVYEQMLSSRSWRFTRPLRDAAVHLRGLRESWRFRLARMRSLRGRVRGSLNRRGLVGTIKRIRHEFEGTQPLTVAFAHPDPDADFTPFAVPRSERPQVSIVIPAYGKLEYTLACLNSIAEHAADTPFEVIVVDDASFDGSVDKLRQIDGVRVHRNTENLGFVGSCNAGAALAHGEFVLFLNNDTLVTTGWLDAMLECFRQREDAGLVGARLIYPDGRLQEAGGIVFADGSGWNYGRLEHPDDPRMNFRRQADYCSGAAIMLRRELFDKLGGFDERYAPAYYEDTDLAFKVREAGLAVYVEPRALVVHFEGISNGTDENAASGLKRFQKINRDKFLDKWRDTLADYHAPVDDPKRAHLAATWRATKRVLIVDASTPTPDQDSGSVRLLNIMRLLRDMGCQVSFLPDNLARFAKYTPLLQAEGIEALYHPFVESLPDFYRKRGREFDLIMISRHYVAAHHLGLVRVHAPQARLAFDTVDLHYLRESRAAELDPRPELRRQAETTRRQELKLIDECDVTLVVSSVEKELLATDAPGARVEILSNVHAIHGCRNGFDAREGLLFVGGFQHPPNIDAMVWFVREVLPLVHAELPEVRLDIVGSKMVPEIEALAGDRVVVHGFVENIEPMLESARISLAPLRYGAGVKGKVNMAMSYGLPVVATPMAVEGIDAEPGRDVLVGADAREYADAVIRLYGDAGLWATLSRNGLENVRRQFSFDAARKTLESLLDKSR